MPQTEVELDIANKADANHLIEVFLDHERTVRIEVTKADDGYKGVFTTENRPAVTPTA
jgi:hypothetical protein